MSELIKRYDELKAQFSERDHRHHDVIAVRRGDVNAVMPGVFPENWPKQVTANMVNIASRQLGEQLGGLPDFNCKSARHNSNTAKKSAEMRTRIVKHQIEESQLQTQMFSGADRYLSFGALPVIVEPEFVKNMPTYRVDSPVGAYWLKDLYGNVVVYYKRWQETAASLAAKFPEHKDKILTGKQGMPRPGSQYLEVVKGYNKDYTCVFVPEAGLKLSESAQALPGKINVFLAELPKWDEESRGQFDEMLWVQLARARMAAYTMEIAHEAVNTPWAVPHDVDKLSLGPRSILRSNESEKIRRVPLDVPPAAFAENQLLANEERLAARFPEGMTGNIDASVITGQGISALLSTVDTQIQVAQTLIAKVLSDAASYALELDEAVFGDMEKVAETSEFAVRYVPSKDIKGDYFVKCTYGFASGMDANRGLIFMLQGQGAGLLSAETIREQMASMFGFNATEEKERIDAEGMQDALKQGVFGWAASIPQMPSAGQDPGAAIRQLATVIDLREKGTPMHEAVLKAFEPTKEEQAAAEQQAQDPVAQLMAGMAGGGGGAPPTPGGDGGPPPDLQMMLAGLTQSGEPNSQVNISRMIPAATPPR